MVFSQKRCGQLRITQAQLEYHMYANSIEFINCITLSEGLKALILIQSRLSKNQLRSILNVLRALTSADISMERTNVFVLTSIADVLWCSLKHFWCKNEA